MRVGELFWMQEPESNRLPSAYKADALPNELSCL